MKRLLFMTLMALAVSMAASGQKADRLYQEGKALYEQKNYAAAFPKLKAAAESGKKGAQYRLARCYDKGHGVEENNEQALVWYQKAADQGHGKAQYQLGKAYMKGKKGLAKDDKKAKALLTKALKNEKHGSSLLKKLRKQAAEGDEDAKAILQLTGKK